MKSWACIVVSLLVYLCAIGVAQASLHLDRPLAGATFDALGRKIVDVQGAGQTTSFTYDPQSQLLTTRDPLSRVTTQVPDPLGRVSSITDPAKGVTSFAYDTHDRLISETAPNSAVTRNSYDGFGRLTKRVSPDSGTATYTYDLADNLTQSTDAAGVVTDHTYDALDRITSTTYTADTSENVALTYDETGHGFGVGRLTSLTDAAGSAAFTYDERGNQLTQSRVSGTVTLTTTTTYDKASRVASITYPSGTLASYTHDRAGHVTAVSAEAAGSTSSVPIVSGVTYAAFGPVTRMSYGNGLAETRAYDLSYRLSKLVTGTVQGLTYSYDAADRATAIADSVTSGNSQAFGYDTLDHLTSAQGGYGSFGWTYDSVGNRLTQSAPGVSSTYTYTAKTNLLTKITAGGSATAVANTAAGNTASVTPASGSAVARTYNQAERLSNVAIGGKQTAAYTYDAFGNRFAKTTAAGTSLFQYDPSGHLLEEATGTGTLKTDTIYLNGAPVADLTPNALFFLHTDRLGTPQVSTTTTGAIAWRAAYQPFGTNTGTSGLFTQNLRFPGQYADAETGDYQNGFRDYDPSLGRYLETDPIGLAGGVNSYAYAENDPINGVDTTGLDQTGYDEGDNNDPFGGSCNICIIGSQTLFFGGNVGPHVGGGVSVGLGTAADSGNSGDSDSSSGSASSSAGAEGQPTSVSGSSTSTASDCSNGCSNEDITVTAPRPLQGTAIVLAQAQLAVPAIRLATPFVARVLGAIIGTIGGETVVQMQGDRSKPPPGSKPISQTPWSGDHQDIKGVIGAGPADNTSIAPNGDVWSQNPDGSWTNYGPAGDYTSSGQPSGQRGKDRVR